MTIKKKDSDTGDKSRKDRAKETDRLVNDYPGVPSEVYDIEASPEMAELYQDMYGA